MTTPPQQLDIFEHNRDVMLRNDVLQALEQRDARIARIAWQCLASELPHDRLLPALNVLTESLEQHSGAPLTDHDALAQARQWLSDQVAPAACQAMGQTPGQAWTLRLWQSLARRCTRLGFDPQRANDHAAALWLRGQDWAEVVTSVERIESWRRIPAPLAWMAEARCRQGQLDTCWPLLAELAWLSPGRLDALLRTAADPLLTRLYKKFGASFDGSGELADLAWFPAWVLVEAPALAPRLTLAQASQHSPAERGMRLLLALLGLERQARHHELVPGRRALRDLHAGLYSAYMATR